MKGRIKVIAQNKFAFPAFLLFISILSYGMLSPWMKFFHDEYSILWFHHRANDVTLFFEGNRPFLAYIYAPLLEILGSNSYLWSLFSILSRWFHALCLFWLVKEIWPNNDPLAIIASMLCIVYPAFQAQFASIMFGILFFLFSLFLLSLLFSLKALKGGENQTFLIITSLFFSFINLSTTEYFFTLEILRYIIIWLYLNKNQIQDLYKVFLRKSLPYLMLYPPMIGWRFFQQSVETTYNFNIGNQLSSISLPKFLNFSIDLIVDLWNVSIGAWIYALFPRHLLTDQSTMALIITLFFCSIVALLCFFYLRNLKSFEENTRGNNLFIFIFSLTAIIAAGIPFWIAKLPIGEHYAFSRWTIPFMLGANILIARLILLGNKSLFAVLLTSFMIAVGVGN